MKRPDESPFTALELSEIAAIAVILLIVLPLLIASAFR